jgi:flagellar biosynthesis protein FliQ
MSTESALALLLGLIQASVHLAAPLLLVSLGAGLVVGVLQAATQLNEGSVSFVVKVTAVLATLLFVGPSLLGAAVQYTRSSLLAIEHVVR